jgi:uncharacterized BrkB/YihY/UPF0761 family membrane protein
MLERLANVIYWTTSTIALLMIPFLAWGWYVGPERERPTVLFGAGIAVGIWLIGRAMRYVLAGK